MFDWLNSKKNQNQQIQEPIQNEVKESEIPKSIEEIQLETYIGKLVIFVSNEVQNVTVGYGKEIFHISKQRIPRLVIHDIVNKVDLMPFGKMFDYTEQKFNALNKLEPNERIAIIYDFGDSTVEKQLLDGVILYSSEEWAEKVNLAVEEWKKENKVVKKIKP